MWIQKIQFFYEFILLKCKNLSKTAKVRNYLINNPSLIINLPEKRNIALSSIVKWQDWGDNLSHAGWGARNSAISWNKYDGQFRAQPIHIEEFNHICTCDIIQYWECNIQKLEGVSSSKSILENFQSLDDLVKTNSTEMISPISKTKLRKNLIHDQIRIGVTWDDIDRKPSSDNFVYHSWDKRIFLSNNGGSHHLAAARYIASQLNEQVKLFGELYKYSLSKETIKSLLSKYDIFLISSDSVAYIGFFQILQKNQVPFVKKYMPRAVDGYALLLPRNEKRSRQLSIMLRRIGLFDLGMYLYKLV